MRFAPRSLFGRLMLVLLAGLLLAQLVSFGIHMHDRGELLARATGRQAAQRMADIVRLLDTLEPSARRETVRAFSAPPLSITLDAASLPMDGDAAADGGRAALFGAMLRRLLGEDRAVVVRVYAGRDIVTAAPGAGAMPHMGAMKGMGPGGAADRGPGMGPGAAWPPPWAGMHGAMQGGLSFLAQVPLRDGTLVTFDSRQPAATASWPYRVLASLAVLLAAVVAVSWLAVRWATRPLAALADAADELGRNLDRPPMSETGPQEVVRAARAFNTMQSRLSGYLRDRVRVLAAMSHDLKTPITRLRLRAELVDDERGRAKLTGDLDELEAMVRDTLDFLRGLEGGERPMLLDVNALLESLAADAGELGGSVTVEGRAAAPLHARPQALKRCLRNLVENAVKYGGAAAITVRDAAEQLEIVVGDNGPGLPETELERVFEPFYRVEASRNRATGGTGLGLTIARSIAGAHGGRLLLRNRAGGGLDAVLTLPRTGASPGNVER